MDLASIGLEIKSDGLRRGVSELDRLKLTGREAEHTTKRLETQTGRLNKEFHTLSNTIKAAGAALAAFGVAGMGKDLLEVNKEFDRLEASLETVTGSARAADVAFEEIQEFAKATPYQLSEVTDAFIKLKALGLDGGKEALQSYGNTASAMGKSLNQMIEAVADAATGEFERLKEFGIKSKSEGDRVTFIFRGASTEVGKNAEEIEGYLRRIGELEFAGGMERQMETLGGRLSNLEDAWDSLLRTIGKSGFNEAAAAALDNLVSTVDSINAALEGGGLEAELNAIKTAAELLAIAIGSRLAGSVATATARMLAANIEAVRYQATLAQMAGVSRTAAAAQTALSGAVSAARGVMAALGGPAGAAIMAATAIYQFRTELGLVAPQATQAEDAVRGLTEGIEELTRAQAEARLATALDEYVKAKESLAEVRTEIEATTRAIAEMESQPMSTMGIGIQDIERLSALRTKLMDLNAEYDTAQQKIDKVNDIMGQLQQIMSNASKTTSGAAKEEENLNNAMDAVARAFDLRMEKMRNENRYREEMQKATMAWLKKERDAVQEAADAYADLMGAIQGVGNVSGGSSAMGDPLTEGISKAVEAMNRLNATYAEERSNLNDIADLRERIRTETVAGTKERQEAIEALNIREKALAEQSLETQIGGYRELFGTTSRLFDEHSKERKKLNQLEQAFAAIEIALQMRKAVVSATAAIANQGSGDPYTAFGRIAAMGALMAGVLASAGIAFGGGSGGGSAPTANPYSGSVLGSDEASQSASNVLDLLDDIHAKEYRELRGIHTSMENLNRNITGLVSNIALSTKGQGGLEFAGTGIEFAFFRDWTQRQISGSNKLFQPLLDPLGSVAGSIPIIGEAYDLLGDVLGTVGGWVDDLVGGIFGGKTKTSIVEAGFELGQITVGQLQDGISAAVQQYNLIKIKKDGGWFGKNKTSYKDVYQAVDDSITRMFTNILGNVGDSITAMAENLGDSEDVQRALDYTFDVGRINLKGLDAKEMEERLGEMVSFEADKAAETVLEPIISMYQRVDEGLFETAARMMATKEIVTDALSQTGISIEDNVLNIVDNIANLAGGLADFQKMFDVFYTNFFNDAEKQQRRTENLSGIFADLNKQLPETRDAYKDLVESLDVTTLSGQQAYVTLLDLASMADEYYSHKEKLQKERFGLEVQILRLTGKESEALALERQKELKSMDASLRPMQERIWALEEQKEAEEAAAQAIREAAQAARSLGDQRISLENQLLELTGNSALAVQRQRQLELNALNDTLKPLQERIWALQDEQELLEAMVDAVSGAEQDLRDAFRNQKDIIRAAYDDQVDVVRDKFDKMREVVESILTSAENAAESARENLKEAQDAMSVAEMDVHNSFDEQVKIATDAYKEQTAQLKMAHQEQSAAIKAAYESNIESISSKIDTLKDNVSLLSRAADSLTDSRRKMEDIDRSSILRSIMTLRGITSDVSSGDLSGLEDLDYHLGILTADNAGLYESFADYQRDYKKSENAITSLEEQTGKSLTIEQRTLYALEEQLKTVKQQHENEMNLLDENLSKQLSLAEQIHNQHIADLEAQRNRVLGIEEYVLSVDEAIKKYAAAEKVLEQAIRLDESAQKSLEAANRNYKDSMAELASQEDRRVELLSTQHNAQIAKLDEQLNGILGIDNSILTLAQAISQYQDAVAALISARPGNTGSDSTGSDNTGGGSTPTDNIGDIPSGIDSTATSSDIRNYVQSTWGDDLDLKAMYRDMVQYADIPLKAINDAMGGDWKTTRLWEQVHFLNPPPSGGFSWNSSYTAADIQAALQGITDPLDIYEMALDHRVPLEQVRQALSVPSGVLQSWLTQYDLPAFATGGTHPGGWRVVGEQGPELEYTGASKIFSNAQSRNMLDTSALEQQIKALHSDIKAAQFQIARNTGKSAKLLDRWDGDGLPEERAV